MSNAYLPRAARRIITYAQALDRGGVERALLRLTTGWLAAGREVTLVIGEVDGPLADELPRGLDLIELGSRDVSALRILPRYVRAREADIVFCPGNHYTSLAVWTRLALGQSCPPIVAKVSNALKRRDHRGLIVPAYRFWLRRHPRWIDHFVAMTEGMRHETEAMMRVAPHRVSVIPNPPTPTRPHAAPPPPGRYMIGVGRLEQQKRWDRLIAALPRLANQDTSLLLVGEGRGRPELEAQVSALGLGERVLMPGYVRDPSRLIAGAAVTVLTSDFEGVPNVLRESLAVGTPIVSTDSSVAVREIIAAPDWGTVVPREDPDALVAALDSWLDPARPRPDPVPQPGDDAVTRYLQLFDRLVARRG
jgi:glycosyltransferase involved in cell wall biosynthesis